MGIATQPTKVGLANGDELLKEIEEDVINMNRLLDMGMLTQEEIPSRDILVERMQNYYLKNVRLEVIA